MLASLLPADVAAQRAGVAPAMVLKPARVFDGADLQDGWIVVVRGERIEAAGPASAVTVPPDAESVAMPGTTLMPGLIEGHSHVLLHPYNETSWNDQVLREPLALRVARATSRRERRCMAGFTTVRDLGTEGAGYADVGLKMAIDGHHSGSADARHRRRPSSPPAAMARRASRPSARSRRAPKRPTASTALTRVVRAIRSVTAPM